MRRSLLAPPATGPTLAAAVRAQTGVAWSRARALCIDGRVTVNGQRCTDPASRISSQAAVVVNASAPRVRSDPLDKSAILFFDRDVVVVDKPAGMLCVADASGNTDTLANHARTLLRRLHRGTDAKLGVVHRLDRETSGLMVFARTAQAQRALAAQFRAHEIDRVYLALVHGAVAKTSVDTHLLRDRGDGLRGSLGRFRRASEGASGNAKRSVTHVSPIERFPRATLIECRLETGRQHQIRIHLAEIGHPILGERVYVRDYIGATIDSPRTMLHARILGFVHPRSGERMSFDRDPPDDFRATVETLRASHR